MMIYFAEGSLPWNIDDTLPRSQRFMMVRSLKEDLTPQEICINKSSNDSFKLMYI
jgi:hypothetical protein